ncbi:MAG: hypothetical protein ACRCWI_01165 [Brevinema sp.]
MKYLFYLSLITAPIFTQTHTELLNLQQNYKQYLSHGDPLITDQLPYQSIPLMENYEFIIPPLDILNPITAFAERSLDEQRNLVELDLVKLSVFLFIITNTEQLQNQAPDIFYKKIFTKSELRLLSLAKQALKVEPNKVKLLTTEYNLLILFLSAFPFPSEYSFYRRRRAYSLETPEIAQQEIDRLNQSLKNLQ